MTQLEHTQPLAAAAWNQRNDAILNGKPQQLLLLPNKSLGTPTAATIQTTRTTLLPGHSQMAEKDAAGFTAQHNKANRGGNTKSKTKISISSATGRKHL